METRKRRPRITELNIKQLEDWMSTDEVASALNFTTVAIRKRIEAGSISLDYVRRVGQAIILIKRSYVEALPRFQAIQRAKKAGSLGLPDSNIPD